MNERFTLHYVCMDLCVDVLKKEKQRREAKQLALLLFVVVSNNAGMHLSLQDIDPAKNPLQMTVCNTRLEF